MEENYDRCNRDTKDDWILKGGIHDIDHFLKVWAMAKTIGALEGLDKHT